MSDTVKMIINTVREVLGRPIDLSLRAQQAIETSLDVEIPIAGDLIWGLATTSPAISEVLLSGGFNLAKIPGPGTILGAEHRPGEFSLKTALQFSLLQPLSARAQREGTPGEPTKRIQEAVARGTITELDLLRSLVDVATLDHHSSSAIILFNCFDDPTHVDELLSQLGFTPGPPYPPYFYGYSDDSRSYSYALAERLREELMKVPLIDIDHANQQLAFCWDGQRIRLACFGSFGLYHIGAEGAGESTFFQARGNVLHPAPFFTEETIEELEHLINIDARESAFQAFFERHPAFLTGIEYRRLYPQWILPEDREGWLIPDFFLEKVDSNFVDLVDLKRPTARLTKHPTHRVGLTAAFHEVADQLRTYRNWFDDPRNRDLFRERHKGLDGYKPQVIIVMGRSRDFYSEQERIMLEAELPRYVTLLTYDDIVARAQRFIDFVKGGR